MAAKKAAQAKPSNGGKLDQEKADQNLGHLMVAWHHAICQVTGGLALKITRRSITRREVKGWADALATTAAEMQDWVNK